MKKYIQKTNILLILCLTLTFIVSFALIAPTGLSNAQNNTLMQPLGMKNMSNTTKSTNIVLVHGGWADGSSWGKVIPILRESRTQGYSSTTRT